MKLDIELYATLNLDDYIVYENGILVAIQTALESANFSLDGVAYIPETCDNIELFEHIDELCPEEFSFDAKSVLVLKANAKNADMKHVLERE